MPVHDYSQHEGKTLTRPDSSADPLTWVAECEDCDWMNRRTRKHNAKRCAESHEAYTDGHTAGVRKDNGPFGGDDE